MGLLKLEFVVENKDCRPRGEYMYIVKSESLRLYIFTHPPTMLDRKECDFFFPVAHSFQFYDACDITFKSEQ